MSLWWLDGTFKSPLTVTSCAPGLRDPPISSLSLSILCINVEVRGQVGFLPYKEQLWVLRSCGHFPGQFHSRNVVVGTGKPSFSNAIRG